MAHRRTSPFRNPMCPAKRPLRRSPFPTKPPAFDYQGYSPEILADFTPEIKAEALKAVERFKLGPIFTPPILKNNPEGKEGTFQLPGAGGGANWMGAAADLETGMFYIPSTHGAVHFFADQRPRPI